MLSGSSTFARIGSYTKEPDMQQLCCTHGHSGLQDLVQ